MPHSWRVREVTPEEVLEALATFDWSMAGDEGTSNSPLNEDIAEGVCRLPELWSVAKAALSIRESTRLSVQESLTRMNEPAFLDRVDFVWAGNLALALPLSLALYSRMEGRADQAEAWLNVYYAAAEDVQPLVLKLDEILNQYGRPTTKRASLVQERRSGLLLAAYCLWLYADTLSEPVGLEYEPVGSAFQEPSLLDRGEYKPEVQLKRICLRVLYQDVSFLAWNTRLLTGYYATVDLSKEAAFACTDEHPAIKKSMLRLCDLLREASQVASWVERSARLRNACEVVAWQAQAEKAVPEHSTPDGSRHQRQLQNLNIPEQRETIEIFMRELRIAQITGFVRDPEVKPDSTKRAFRPLFGGVEPPFLFDRDDSNDVMRWDTSDNVGSFAAEQKGRFLEILKRTWPTREGVPVSSLKRLFRPARPIDPEGQKILPSERNAPQSIVLVPDGEVSFFFLLFVIDRAIIEAMKVDPSNRDDILEDWLEGRTKLPTMFRPGAPWKEQWSSMDYWRAEENWVAGTFLDLVQNQMRLFDDSCCTPKFWALEDFLESLVFCKTDEHPIDKSFPRHSELGRNLMNRLRVVGQAFLLSLNTVRSRGVDGLRDGVRAYWSREQHLQSDEIFNLQRVDFITEMAMRVRFDDIVAEEMEPDPVRTKKLIGESLPRTLFFLPLYWEYGGNGFPSVPHVFFAGTMLGHEAPGVPFCQERVGATLSLMTALLPLLDATIMEVMVDGLRQKVLTDKESKLRRQLAHTLHGDLLLVVSLLDINITREVKRYISYKNIGETLDGDRALAMMREYDNEPLGEFADIGVRLRNKGGFPNDDLVGEICSALVGGKASDVLDSIECYSEKFLGAVELSTNEIAHLTHKTRALARLSDPTYRMKFSRYGDQRRRLDRVVSRALMTTLLSILGRCTIAGFEVSGARFKMMRDSFPNMNLESNELRNQIARPAHELDCNSVISVFSDVFGSSLIFQYECPDDIYFDDPDGLNIFASMIQEMLTNALKALRSPGARQPALRCKIKSVAEIGGSKDRERFVESVVFINSTGVDEGAALGKTRKTGGQGLSFIRECAMTLSNGRTRLGFNGAQYDKDNEIVSVVIE